jgi:hypothetical protein
MAGCFALAAFAVAIVFGLAAGNPAGSVLSRALIAMLACYPLGLGVGLVAQHLVREHIEAHRAANPSLEESEVLGVGEAPDANQVNVDEHGRPTDEDVITA